MAMNAKPECTVVNDSKGFHVVDIGRVEYTAQLPNADGLARNLYIHTIERADVPSATVLFEMPVAFRVIDEMHLLEFWNDFSLPNGWLWKVDSGGYLDLERTRKYFHADDLFELSEYLIVGDRCVSVIAHSPPILISPTTHSSG